MMHMAFWFGLHLDDLMIKGLNISTVSGLVAICFGFLSLTLVYEGIRVSREQITEKVCQKTIMLKQNASTTRVPRQEETATERSPLLTTRNDRDTQMGSNEGYNSILHKQRLRYFILQTFLHVVQTAVGYSIMLGVMTYNFYIFMSVVIGAGLGYFCFGLILMSRTLNISCIPRKHSNEELYSPTTHMGLGSSSSRDGTATSTADYSISDSEQDSLQHCHKKKLNILMVKEDDSEENIGFIEAVKDDTAAVGGSSDHSNTHPSHSVYA